MSGLLLLTPGELTRDPRARRAASAAVAAGLEVQGLCVGGDAPAALPDVPVARVEPLRFERRLRAAGLGGMQRSRPIARELRGVYRLLRQILLTVRLSRAARTLGRFEIVHANDLDTLPAAWLVARRGKARLVYDAHELYTLQEPDPPRLHQAVARRVEGFFARRADAVVTVNAEIAAELEGLLRLPTTPAVVLSCPPRDSTPTDIEPSERLRVIYQGAMGPGRALDDILAAAAESRDVELTIRVAGADLAALRGVVAAAGVGDRVVVVEPVPPDALVPALRPFDVGLIINRPVTRNDELVLPNKLFEYLMAGLAVVAPHLPSLAHLIERDEVGLTFAPGDTRAMADTLSRLAADRDLLTRLRTNARAAALDRLNAETQASLLATAWGLG